MTYNRMTIVERTGDRHRSHIIIHDSVGMFYVAEFDSIDQLDFFAKTVGFTYTEVSRRETERYGTFQECVLDRQIDNRCNGGFFSLDQIPESAKPIKALSNGSIVTCYFTNDGEQIRFYRPNPNAKQVYHPLCIDDHIAHVRTYGLY